MISDFKNLQVWQEAQDFASKIYDSTTEFPVSEQYNLTSQLRRAALSISANIAEGTGRSTQRDYCSFLFNARGSNKEVESHLHFAHKRNYIGLAKYHELLEHCTKIGKMLTNLIKSVQEKQNSTEVKDNG